MATLSRLASGTREERVVHVQRREDVLLKIRVEALPGDNFDHAAQHVVAQPVGPPFAGLVRQRGLGQPGDLLGDRLQPAALHPCARSSFSRRSLFVRNPP